MSEYDEEVAKLRARKCVPCDGSGQQNDAEAGDMYYNEWKCPACNGTGLAKGSKS